MLKLKRIFTTAALLLAAVVVLGQNKSAGINLSLWKGLQTQPINEKQTTYFNLGLISAQNRTHGLSLNIIGNNTNKDNKGIQVSGVYSIYKGSNYGLSLAGLFSLFSDDTYGLLIGGLGQVSAENSKGVSLAGLFNITGIDDYGLSIGGVGNFTGYNTNGIYLAGLINYAGDEQRGLQIAGLTNIARYSKGVQIGATNIARIELAGLQVGLFNYAPYGKGVQIGLVNFSKRFRGAQIGLVNLTPTTKYKVMLYGGNQTKVNAAIRFQNKLFYNQIGLGSPALKWGDRFSGAISYRTGIRYNLLPIWEISGDIGVQHINTFSTKDNANGIPRRMYSLQARVNNSVHLFHNIGAIMSVGYGTTRWYSKSETYRKGIIVEAGLYYQL